MDRQGQRTSLGLEPRNYGNFRLSPTGDRLAYGLSDGIQSDIWIYNIARGFPTRLTTDPAGDYTPLWSPDGKSIVFTSYREGPGNLYWRRANLDSEVQRLTRPNNQRAHSWHTNRQHIAVSETVPGAGNDIRILNLEGDDQLGWTAGATTNFLATEFDERHPSFSPDGRWLAYTSNESGQFQVWVRPFNRSGPPKQISIAGIDSRYPIWSRTTNELLFVTQEEPNSPERQVYITRYEEKGGRFIPDPEGPVKWPKGTLYQKRNRRSYNLHPDGQRLLVRSLAETEAGDNVQQIFDHVVLFENFTEHLKNLVPTGKN